MIIDTHVVAPYASGRFVFRYKWKCLDRCDFVFTSSAFGRKYRISGHFHHSLAAGFLAQWLAGVYDPESPFIQYMFSDETNAIHAWQHICRVASNKGI